MNVYDVGDEQNINYIVMELVEGITLKSYIERKGRLTVKEATSILNPPSDRIHWHNGDPGSSPYILK